jgi:hypothetical protein
VPNVGEEGFHERESFLISIAFLHRFHVAELKQRLPPRFLRRDANSQIVCRLHGDVFFNFGLKGDFVLGGGGPGK